MGDDSDVELVLVEFWEVDRLHVVNGTETQQGSRIEDDLVSYKLGLTSTFSPVAFFS